MTQRKFDRSTLREAFGAFPTGVAIVTTRDGDDPVGFTASSVTSVSLDPPMLLFCIDKSSENLETYRDAKGFAVNILSAGQRDLSERFAVDAGDRFDGLEWSWSGAGNPVVAGAVGHFDCATEQAVDAGDHLIVIGTVTGLSTGGDASLCHYRGRYLDLDGHDL